MNKEMTYIVKVIKSTKCNNFIVSPTGLIGSDKEYTTLTVINSALNIFNNLEFSREIFDEMLKKNSELDCDIMNDYCISRIATSPLINIYNSMVNCNKILTISIDDIRSDPQFERVTSFKVADGAYIYKLNRKYMMTLFSGLLPINKNDKVALQVYDIIESDNTCRFFIAKFIIRKGSIVIEKYIKYRFI